MFILHLYFKLFYRDYGVQYLQKKPLYICKNLQLVAFVFYTINTL